MLCLFTQAVINWLHGQGAASIHIPKSFSTLLNYSHGFWRVQRWSTAWILTAWKGMMERESKTGKRDRDTEGALGRDFLCTRGYMCHRQEGLESGSVCREGGGQQGESGQVWTRGTSKLLIRQLENNTAEQSSRGRRHATRTMNSHFVKEIQP